jgi:hypothetical protein
MRIAWIETTVVLSSHTSSCTASGVEAPAHPHNVQSYSGCWPDAKIVADFQRGDNPKGVKKGMNDDRQSRQIKGSGRTYFLDIEKTRDDKPYLRITESRKGAGDKFERNSINVFLEDADEFAQAVSEMASKLE